MEQKKQPIEPPHGGVYASLIKAGHELIRDYGPTALSIRKVAARAGVSHAAPAHHFPHLSDLRCAIVTEGFHKFAAAMETEISKSGGDAHAAVLAACHGYIYFARDNPGLFHLMFATPAYKYSGDAFQHATDAAYEVLRGVCAPFSNTPQNAEKIEVLVWSIAHGYASLFLENKNPKYPQNAGIEVFDTIFPNLPLQGES